MLAQPVDIGFDALQIRCLGAGDAEHRDIIHKPAGVPEHFWGARIIRRRRRQPNEADIGRKRRQAEFAIFLRRQIDNDQAIDTGGLGIGEELRNAIDIDRVIIAHQHDGRILVGLPERLHQPQRLLHVLAGGQGAQARRLNGRTIGHRIGEGHADLDQIGAGLWQAGDDLERCVVVRIAGRHKGDEG